jgi:site-specific recombinase XerC
MSYRYRYQRLDGSQGTVTIGLVQEFSTDQARDMARDLAQERRKGADPAADRKANREADRQAKETFADLAKQYLAAKQMAVRLGDMRASTVDSYSRMLNLHILPRLGAKPFAEMKRAEIKLAIQDIMATTMEKHRDNHRVVNGGRVAGAALSVIKMIFTWAIREELADKNPAQTLQPPARYRTRERVLSMYSAAQMNDPIPRAPKLM